MGMLDDILNDVGDEIKRQGRQGANELAAGLFSDSNAFVQYGDGQRVHPQHEQAVEAPEPQVAPEPNQGMEL